MCWRNDSRSSLAMRRWFSVERKKRSKRLILCLLSNGGLATRAFAARFPAHIVESGPAAGIMA
ncbi:MAG: hypothetical protein J0J15_12015, partial [Mesorhizobium sp.]|nr:hypothetical protein [Mesorhizobium sp.]